MLEKEKRRIQRFDFNQPIELKICATRRTNDCPIRQAKGVDINSRGIGLEAAEELLKGELVKMRVPQGTDGAFIPVFAEVRWVSGSKENYRAGLHFLS